MNAVNPIEPEPPHMKETQTPSCNLRQGPASAQRELSPRPARQPQLHGWPQRARRVAADRLRPQERHDLAALRRQGLPDDHRDVFQEEARRRGHRRSRTSASSANASSPWSSAGPRSAAAAAGGHHPTASSCWRKLGLPTIGASTYVLLDFLGDVVLRRVRPADRPRHVPEGDRRRLRTTCSRSTSPTTVCSAVEYFRKLSAQIVRRSPHS